MMRRIAARTAVAVVLAAGTLVSLAMPATANPAASAITVPAADKAETMIEAMQRDLGLTLRQAKQRLHQETIAERVQQRVEAALSHAYAGSFYNSELGKLVVSVTDRASIDKASIDRASIDKASIDKVRGASAKVRLVDDSLAELNAAAKALNSNVDAAPSSITGWYVDPASNSVVVTTAMGSAPHATKFVHSVVADAGAVKVNESSEQPKLYSGIHPGIHPGIHSGIVGGNPYYIDSGTRCSIGFAVSGGFLSAGHCGNVGVSTSSPRGTFVGSSFPVNDYSYIKSPARLTALVNKYYDGTVVTVAGSREAPVGASVCRSGSTTGWHCGEILAKNQTVFYPQGTVYGLTRTNVCSEPGDSGGPFLSGHQAQGMTSGGFGNCTIGGVTYFQPVDEALRAYGVQLITVQLITK